MTSLPFDESEFLAAADQKLRREMFEDAIVGGLEIVIG
jgi:hypothetical protein